MRQNLFFRGSRTSLTRKRGAGAGLPHSCRLGSVSIDHPRLPFVVATISKLTAENVSNFLEGSRTPGKAFQPLQRFGCSWVVDPAFVLQCLDAFGVVQRDHRAHVGVKVGERCAHLQISTLKASTGLSW